MRTPITLVGVTFLVLGIAACVGEREETDDTEMDTDDTGTGLADTDRDGWTIVDGDCDDGDPSVYPDAPEALCDGRDSDCDGEGEAAAALLDGVEYTDIAAALTAAMDGDTVEICPGTWTVPELVLDATGMSLTLQAFSGSAADTVLDGAGTNRILQLWGPAEITLEDLTFQNGYTTDDHYLGWGVAGGAVLASAVGLTIEDCVFDGNVAHDFGARGGALWIDTWDESDGLVATGCTFRNNAVDYLGGAIAAVGYGGYRPVELTSCTFSGNTGPAVYLNDLGLTATDTTFSENVTEWGGKQGPAALKAHLYDHDPVAFTFDGCHFLENESPSVGVASLYFSGVTATVEFTSSVFEGNHAEYGAGALYLYADGASVDIDFDKTTFQENVSELASSVVDLSAYGTVGLSMTGCVFDGNTSGYGPAVSMHLRKEAPVSLSMQDTTFEGQVNGSLTSVLEVLGGDLDGEIRNCTFEGNASERGGTIRINGTEIDSLTIVDSTFRWNTGGSYGGTALRLDGAGVVVLDNVVVDGNTGTTSGAFWLGSYPNLTVTMNGGSVTRNTGTDTGGLRVDAGTFESVAVDWGTGETDNTPNDVLGCHENFGDAASFVATTDGCVTSP
ncbi:MAG: hypothetical protein JXB39_10750 [Deltaproteobacteria bacterium]|nr:hypothetical protein [Deltaproteobacteria bacterium]